MKKLIHSIMLVCLLATSTLSFTSCANMSGTVSSAQSWLSDPKNQATISAIAQVAITILTSMAVAPTATTHATIAGKLAATYPNVPAGAIAEIARNPYAYVKH